MAKERNTENLEEVIGKCEEASQEEEQIEAAETFPEQGPQELSERAYRFVSGRYFWVAALAVYIIAGFILYAKVIGGGFMFDDNPNIFENKYVRMSTLSVEALRRAGFESPCGNRPVANISFALNYYFDRYNVAGYHVVNILIHVFMALFLFFLIKATLDIHWRNQEDPSHEKAYPSSLLAFFAVLIWFAHPVQTQAVSYIVQRMASMAGMFYVLSLLLYVRGRLDNGWRRWFLFGGSVLSGVLAVGSKEIAATLPILVFLYEWYFFQDLSWDWLKKTAVPLGGIVIAMAAVGCFYVGLNPVDWITDQYATRSFTLSQRVMTEFRVVVLYLTLLALPLPSRLNLDYGFPISHSLVDPFTTVLSLGAIVCLAVLAVYLAKRKRILSFAIVWFLGNLVIESTVIPLELVYEHRLYVPSMFVFAGLAVEASRYMTRPRWLFPCLLCAVFCVLSFWTIQRNTVWKSELYLWQDVISKSPNKARPYLGLGEYYEGREKYKEALEQYTIAIRMDPGYPEAHYNMGNTYKKMGNMDEALRYYTKTIKLSPQKHETYNNIGVVLAERNDLSGALEYFKKARSMNPDLHPSENIYNIGFTLFNLGRGDEAIAELLKIEKEDNEFAKANCTIGDIYAKKGDTQRAADFYKRSIAADPKYIPPYMNLGNIMYAKGDVAGALEQYKRVLKVEPKLARAYFNIGNLFMNAGDMEKATAFFQKALSIDPRYIPAYKGLGMIMFKKGDTKGAIEQLQAILRVDPGNKEVMQILASVQGAGLDKGVPDRQYLKQQQILPKKPAEYIRLGDMYRKKGDKVEAIRYYLGALALDKENVPALSRLAVAYGEVGADKKALEVLKILAQKIPGSPEVYYNVACIYAKHGQVDESVKWLKVAVDKGFRDKKQIAGDKDLENIRGSAYYMQLMGGLH